MKIGIDVSQLAYPNTGVSNYLLNLVSEMVKNDKNEFVLFYSSLRKPPSPELESLGRKANVVLRRFRIPPSALHVLWNTMHLVSVEQFVGPVDIFITSDWTEPPAKKAKKATILYDLIVYKFSEETHSKTEFGLSGLKISSNIVAVQKQKHKWVRRESDIIFCISEATRKDAIEFLGLDEKKLRVIYPGLTV